MATDPRLDELISNWLEETAPEVLPARVLAATFERTRQSKQQVRWPAPMGRPRIARFVPALGGAAAVAVAAVLVIHIGLFSGPGGTRTPTPSATASPSASARPTPPPSGPEITGLMNGFLRARIAGGGAGNFINGPREDFPLLYATTSGVPYERAAFERVVGVEWAYGLTAFKVRMFAAKTVVEQLVFAPADGSLGFEYVPDGFGTDIAPTTEDGQPVAAPYDAFNGEVMLQLVHPWVSRYGEKSIRLIPDGARPTTDGGERNDWDRLVVMADPARSGTGCPAGSGPADAEALAESIRSDPDLQATAPVAMSAGRAGGLMMDVALPAGASEVCGGLLGVTELLVPENVRLAPGDRMRLYLFDAPGGASMRILAIAIVVPESHWERAVEATTPLVSVDFRTP
jgi:hypothetical protein